MGKPPASPRVIVCTSIARLPSADNRLCDLVRLKDRRKGLRKTQITVKMVLVGQFGKLPLDKLTTCPTNDMRSVSNE